jgi:hypothetical protein
MIKPATFFGTPWLTNLFWVSGDEEFITVRGLLRRRRVALDRVIAVPGGQTILWCGRRGRMRRKRVWFFFEGRDGSDPNYAERRGMERWFVSALQDQHGGGKKSAKYWGDESLRSALQVARLGEKWSGRRDADLHKLWSRRLTVLQGELDRRSQEAPQPDRSG